MPIDDRRIWPMYETAAAYWRRVARRRRSHGPRAHTHEDIDDLLGPNLARFLGL